MRNTRRLIVGFTLVVFWAGILLLPASSWAKPFLVSGHRSYSMPKQIQFADEAGNKIERMLMEGTEVRTVYVDVVDFNKNGRMDANDYQLFSIPLTASLDILVSGDNSADIVTSDDLLNLSPDLRPRLENALEEVWKQNFIYRPRITFTQDLLDVNEDVRNPLRLNFYPRRLSLLRVHAQQQPGNQGAKFDEQFADLKYSLFFGNREELEKDEMPKLAVRAETPRMSVTIRASDQGGQNADNGGGSCNALALGTASLLVPGLLLLRRRKG